MIDIAKLREYCLNPNHRRGQLLGVYNGRECSLPLLVFRLLSSKLQHALIEAINTQEAEVTREDQYGQRYGVDFKMQTVDERQARVRTTWIIRRSEDFPRPTACYVL